MYMVVKKQKYDFEFDQMTPGFGHLDMSKML